MATAPIQSKSDGISDEASRLADAVHGIIGPTARAAEDTGMEVRQQFEAAVDRGRDAYDSVCDAAADGARLADEVLHQQPYKSLAVALGFGTLFGFFLARR